LKSNEEGAFYACDATGWSSLQGNLKNLRKLRKLKHLLKPGHVIPTERKRPKEA
jgi:hypothetical protein